MAVGAILSRGGKAPTQEKIVELASKCRKHLLRWVGTATKAQTLIDGVPVSTWLLDTAERPGITTIAQYLERMSGWGRGRDQWGGFPEVAVLSQSWEAWTVLLQESANGKSWTLRSCVGTMSKHNAPICIMRTNTEDHWVPVSMSPSAVAKLRDYYMAHTSKQKPK
jgi:hypothetical protein